MKDQLYRQELRNEEVQQYKLLCFQQSHAFYRARSGIAFSFAQTKTRILYPCISRTITYPFTITDLACNTQSMPLCIASSLLLAAKRDFDSYLGRLDLSGAVRVVTRGPLDVCKLRHGPCVIFDTTYTLESSSHPHLFERQSIL